MGHVLGQIVFGLATFTATVVPCWLLLRHGQKTGRMREARVLLVVVALVAATAFAAVLYSWPKG